MIARRSTSLLLECCFRDTMSRHCAASVEHWHSIAGVEDALVADLIRRDGIDLLIDLSGHTERNRLAVFARHPVPLQITWLGYLNTTGLAAMNYRICDRYTDPEGLTERFTSKLYRSTNSLCYAPVYELALTRAPCRPPYAIVFGHSTNTPRQAILPDLWCSVPSQSPSEPCILTTPGKTQAAFAAVYPADIDPVAFGPLPSGFLNTLRRSRGRYRARPFP